MPNWYAVRSEIETEMQQSDIAAFYVIRRKYLDQLHEKTQRNILIYASNWTWSTADSNFSSISIDDIYGLMAVMSGLSGPNLDLILHTPGGSTAAAEAIVSYLRQKFENIRVIIPHAAMSAGTLISCGANQLVMGKHSFIGPTDPQVLVRYQDKIRYMPAQSILDDFDKAMQDCSEGNNIAAWTPILNQYPMGLLTDCKNSIKLSRDLAQKWLEKYMFAEDPKAEEKSKNIADWLSAHDNFHTHNRFIPRVEAREHLLDIIDLEEDQELQDLVLSIFHTILLQFGQLPTCPKIMENHLGSSFFPPLPLK